MISSSRQEALACLLCDVALSTLDMAEDANVTSTLRLQFTAILKDILFERVRLVLITYVNDLY